MDNIGLINQIFEVMLKKGMSSDNTSSEYDTFTNYLKEIYFTKHPCEFVNELLIKLKLPQIKYEYSVDEEFPWKCSAILEDTDISGTGYNTNKKEARSK